MLQVSKTFIYRIGITNLETRLKYMSKISGVMVAMFQAYQNVDDAKRYLDVANENLAKVYAELPWTMAHIVQDINSNVASGQFDRATGDWLIQRVQEIHSH